ncbi:hypothetical protein [Nocardia sp. NBC_00511]|uniref:hypothetical protein n=1 Tax=Nocardia sp. NBC_00511 TaxID=2903591 RepID=UPI0030E43327
MIREEFIDAATGVIGICQSRDPYFPAGGDALVLGWAEVFQESGLSPDDLLVGARHAYKEASEGFRPLPSTIVQHARAAYFEQLKALSEEQRELMENANHVLQELGVSPPDAHRASRRIALGRNAGIALTAEQQDKYESLMAARRALDASPRRPLGLGGIVKGVNETLAQAATPPTPPPLASVPAGPPQSTTQDQESSHGAA